MIFRIRARRLFEHCSRKLAMPHRKAVCLPIGTIHTILWSCISRHSTAFLRFVISQFSVFFKTRGGDFNEIARCAMKSSRGSDEIFGVPPQMKLNPSFYPDEVGFHHEVISSHDSGIYPVRKDGFS